MPRFPLSTTDRAWRLGEPARFDIGCTVDGYWADIVRTAVLGGEDERFRLARPGLTAAEVFATAVGTVERGGITPYRRRHCGHGIGQSVYEAPIISPGVAPLAARMTFCFETPYCEVGWGGMMVEDLVLITDRGLRVLTDADRSLRVVRA